MLSRQLTGEGTSSDATQRRQLQKNNAQLRVKVTDLLRELEEVRNEREQLGQPSDVVTRLHAKQIAQQADRNRTLEVNAPSTCMFVAPRRKAQTPLHGHRLRTCCTTQPTDTANGRAHNSSIQQICHIAMPEPNVSTCQDVRMWQIFVRWW